MKEFKITPFYCKRARTRVTLEVCKECDAIDTCEEYYIAISEVVDEIDEPEITEGKIPF